MKQIILITLILLILPSFACKEPTKEEYGNFYKNIKLNKTQIFQLQEIKKQKYIKTENALEQSRNYRKTHPELSKEERNEYLSKKLAEIQEEYEQELLKIMNRKQQKQILFQDSLVF